MAKFKFTMLFEATSNNRGFSDITRQGGWSESLYYEGEESTAFPHPILLQRRAALLGTSARIVGQRLQKVFPSGQSKTFGRIVVGGSGAAVDMPQVALLCYGKSASSPNIRRFTLRGIPDDMVVDGEFSPTTRFQTALTIYFNHLRDSNWGFPGRDLSIRPQALTAIDPAGVVTSGGAFSCEVGDRVTITRTEDAYKTLHTVTTRIVSITNSTNFKVQGWEFGQCVGGTILNITPKSIFVFGVIEANRAVVRKVGRPFAGYRGRASKRK